MKLWDLYICLFSANNKLVVTEYIKLFPVIVKLPIQASSTRTHQYRPEILCWAWLYPEILNDVKLQTMCASVI